MSHQTHLEVFRSEYHMLQFFGKYLEKLDVNSSARLGPFLYSYDGKLMLARGFHDFLGQMEKMIGLDIDIRSSAQKGTSFLVFFKKEPKDAKRFREECGKIEAIKEVAFADAKEKQMETATLVSNEIKPVEVKEDKDEVVELSPEKQAIIDAALELRDDSKKSASKSALEAFAMEHGVSLSKGKTFDGMIEDFIAAL